MAPEWSGTPLSRGVSHLPPRSASWAARLCLRSRHLRAARPRSPAEPSQGDVAVRSPLGDDRGHDRLQASGRRALAPATTGVLLDPEIGVAQCIVDGSLPARSGLLVAVEETGYEGPSNARVTRILDGWSVAKAKRIGASALKLLIYYHPEAANAADQERLVEQVAREAIAEDIPLFLEPLSFSWTLPAAPSAARHAVTLSLPPRGG